ncbi:muscular LMNA-interacting protein [Callorhinchus milii]|uniref:muscular LMNA-interacting protein n=1 Tax=Callorhinchus milii TaxID=7868 RepID=UPI0004571D44|nr:muscular LMNA-interacting protein [Callorhinchus milii]|eukprot:gi/632953158/ref/XP_007892253.1/ PREDICTED: muscular LMNA-interacting protein [Callorhinchus milii]
MQVSGKVPRELGKIAGSHRVDSAESTAEGTLVETLMDPLAIKTLDEELLAMKSEANLNETAKPLAFTFVPIVRRLPILVQIAETTRPQFQPTNQLKPGSQSPVMNEPLHIAEDMSTVGVLSTDIDGQGALGRCLKEKDVHTSSEQVTVQDGIFKAELVYLADSNESDGFSGSSGTQFRHSAAKLPFSSQSPGLVANRNFTPAKVLVGESKLPVLRLAEKKVDGPWQKSNTQYKIKSSYKTFAAIPTNTLLLEQKAVDEAVSEDFGESGECKTSERSQSEFLYEPESLRRQTDELCATIERVLEEPLPSRCSSSTPTSLQKFLDSEAQKPKSPVPRTSGRETKYANLYLPASDFAETKSTKPGVIRPVTIVHKVPVTPEKVEYCPNPFRQYLEETTDAEIREQLFPCSTILTTVSYPKSCHHMYQTVPCCPEMSQSVPLSLSPVTSLTSGSYIRFSPNIPSNYYMTSNLSRSVHSLYIKPRHSITTIHENEALGSKELVDVATRLNRELLETRGKEWKEKVLEQKVNNNQGTLVITEE